MAKSKLVTIKKPKLLQLRPTQFVLGMKEIESKVSKMRSFSKKDLAEYCDDHKIPVVIGPHQEVFMIDHHHFLRACWELELNCFSIKVIEDMSHLSKKEFWNSMIKNDWLYLHDQFGLGPHSPSALPLDIRCLADDPFRSLAWAALNSGIILKQDTPFFEFKWASFFRIHLNFPLYSKSDFKDAIRAIKKLARSELASHLPGFIGG